MNGFSKKWGLIVLHSSLPSQEEQTAQARAFGIAEDCHVLDGQRLDFSPLFVEDLRKVKKTTNWQSKMVERETLLKRLKAYKVPGETLFFSTPLCVGFSASIARWTVEMVFDARMGLYVHSLGETYFPSDDVEPLFIEVDRAANAAYQAALRKRRSAKKK